MKSIFLLAFLLVASAQARKPNVLLIYTDDQGSMDAGCYGSKDLETPHIDRLAREGLRFTQMYSPSAICSASRAGLMTGRFPARAGVPANVSSTKGQGGMPTSEVTLAEMFKAAGYATGHIGKWHLGYTPETMPNGQGFDYSYGHMGGCIDNYSHFFYWQGPNRHDLWRNGKEIFEDGTYFGDRMLAEVQQFVHKEHDQDAAKPWFIYWAWNWPHYPLQGTDKWREHYKDLPHPRNLYNAFVSSMDERIGTALDFLEMMGLRDDTIIIFQSDHGHSIEERTHFSGGNPGPYRGHKGCLFEGGIRVPSIVSWPAKLPKNEVRDQLVTGCDWLPTLAELCEIDPPAVHLDGKSIAGVLRDAQAKTPHERFYWQLGPNPKNAQWVVREGPWKLLGNPKDRRTDSTPPKGNYFLANLEEDVSESKDLKEKHPNVFERLKAAQATFAAGLQAKPAPAKPGKP